MLISVTAFNAVAVRSEHRDRFSCAIGGAAVTGAPLNV
jgi:hypothetical protein